MEDKLDRYRKRVFVSYVHSEPDQALAAQIALVLKRDHEVFIDLDMTPGADWGAVIHDQIQRCDYFVVLVSGRTLSSDMVLAEVEVAYNLQRTDGSPTLIPVRLQLDGPFPFPLSAHLNRFHNLHWGGQADTTALMRYLKLAIEGPPLAAEMTSVLSVPREKHVSATGIDLSMIRRVRYDYIDKLLNDSLWSTARMKLALTTRPESIDHPLSVHLERSHQEPITLPFGTSIVSVFDNQLGQLLILGSAGSGKTTLLLELARELLKRAESDESEPLPVVFNLGSWSRHRPGLADWLIEQLNEQYDVPRGLAQDWVVGERLLPLLDGLDEVPDRHREDCVVAINKFRNQQHGLHKIVVCTRSDEYDALAVRLRLAGAIAIQPLTRATITAYLTRGGPPLEGLLTAVRQDTELCELVCTPLMLGLSILVYRGWAAGDIVQIGTREQKYIVLLDRYVTAMLERFREGSRYTFQQTRTWLSKLARNMIRLNQSLFFLENLSPAWFTMSIQRWVVNLSASAVTGLIAGFILTCVQAAWSMVTAGQTESFNDWQAIWIGSTALFGVLALPAYMFGPRLLRPVERIAWNWSTWQQLPLAQLRGIVVQAFGFWGLGLIFYFFLYADVSSEYVISAAQMGGVMSMLVASSRIFGYELSMRTKVNEGVRRSARMAVTSYVTCAIIIFLIRTIVRSPIDSVEDASYYATFAGLTFGGLYCVRYVVLRAMLFASGLAPLHYVQFLEHATRLVFLRSIAGGYDFRHRQLMEYFAGLDSSKQD